MPLRRPPRRLRRPSPFAAAAAARRRRACAPGILRSRRIGRLGLGRGLAARRASSPTARWSCSPGAAASPVAALVAAFLPALLIARMVAPMRSPPLRPPRRAPPPCCADLLRRPPRACAVPRLALGVALASSVSSSSSAAASSVVFVFGSERRWSAARPPAPWPASTLCTCSPFSITKACWRRDGRVGVDRDEERKRSSSSRRCARFWLRR